MLSVICQWEQDRRQGLDTSWQLPASGRDSAGIAASCPAVRGVQRGTGYDGSVTRERLLLEFP